MNMSKKYEISKVYFFLKFQKLQKLKKFKLKNFPIKKKKIYQWAIHPAIRGKVNSTGNISVGKPMAL